LVKPVHKWDGVRRWSLGVHGTVVGYNQIAGMDRVVLGGAGFQLRLRSKGRWGFEAAQDFLHGSFLNGALVRNSFPFQLSVMFYVFKNEDTRHFNLYALAGAGLQPSSIDVLFAPGDTRNQDFMEVEGHIGAGAELRFKWFAVSAEVRGVGLVRDDTTSPATYYAGVTGEPVPRTTGGVLGRLNLSLWF
jgi:hypothetical protein